MPITSKEDGRPATLFYWNDWFSSFDVRSCSLAARGLWIDLIGIMAQSSIKGTLLINGEKPDNKTIAKLLAVTEREVGSLLDELFRNGVYSKLADGTIINRRMYAESELSRTRSEAGRKGMKSRWQTDNKEEEVCNNKTDNKEDNKIITNYNINKYNLDISNKDNIVGDVVSYFNQVTGQGIRPDAKYVIDLITPRVKEGFTLDDFKKVIDKKHNQWKDNPEMCGYIRPSTLFCRKHFEEYLNENVPHEETLEEYKKRMDFETYGPGGKPQK